MMLVTAVVTWTGAFPLDMLQHESCFPADESAAQTISNSIEEKGFMDAGGDVEGGYEKKYMATLAKRVEDGPAPDYLTLPHDWWSIKQWSSLNVLIEPIIPATSKVNLYACPTHGYFAKEALIAGENTESCPCCGEDSERVAGGTKVVLP